MKSKFLKSLALLISATGIWFGGLGAAQAADAAGPDVMLNQAITKVRGEIKANHDTYISDKAAFYSMVRGEIVPLFDTSYIAKVILGKHLREATPEQVKDFEVAFENSLMQTYADSLLKYYDSVDIKVGSPKINGANGTVPTQILRKDGQPPVEVDFSIRQSDGQWKIWDIKAENISLVLNFRTQMDSEIAKTSINDVITRLKAGTLQVAAPQQDDKKGAN